MLLKIEVPESNHFFLSNETLGWRKVLLSQEILLIPVPNVLDNSLGQQAANEKLLDPKPHITLAQVSIIWDSFLLKTLKFESIPNDSFISFLSHPSSLWLLSLRKLSNGCVIAWCMLWDVVDDLALDDDDEYCCCDKDKGRGWSYEIRADMVEVWNWMTYPIHL